MRNTKSGCSEAVLPWAKNSMSISINLFSASTWCAGNRKEESFFVSEHGYFVRIASVTQEQPPTIPITDYRFTGKKKIPIEQFIMDSGQWVIDMKDVLT